MTHVHVPPPRLGFGNVIIKLADYIRKVGPDGGVDESILDFERGRAFQFHLKLTKGLPQTVDGDILCNPQAYTHLSHILPTLMAPTQELLEKVPPLDEITMGIHVRCGCKMPDCKGLAAADGSAFFATDETFKTIHAIILNCEGKVFLASDSKEVKKMYTDAFMNKVVTLDTEITLSCEPDTCGGISQNSKSLMDTYLEWCVLSKCPRVVTTSGPGYDPVTDKGAGVSTFGYTAAAYGRKELFIIHCNGFVSVFKPS